MPHHLQLRVGDVNRHKFHELGKSLLQPEIIPPLHRHQVSKPLSKPHSLFFKRATAVLLVRFTAPFECHDVFFPHIAHPSFKNNDTQNRSWARFPESFFGDS